MLSAEQWSIFNIIGSRDESVETEDASERGRHPARQSALFILSPRSGQVHMKQVNRRSLVETLDYIQRLEKARSSKEICAEVLQYVSRFGATKILSGTIPRPGSSRNQQLGHVLLADWPEEWGDRYFGKGYLFRDPTIRLVNAGHAPFLWSEIDQSLTREASAQRVMGEAGDFGLKAGFTIAMPTLDGEAVGFSIAGRQLDIGPEDRSVINLIAAYAIGRALLLQEGSRSGPSILLSPRECEALQLASEGLAEKIIGERMGISVHGADKHLRSVRQKLGVGTSIHAVGKALRLGLIR